MIWAVMVFPRNPSTCCSFSSSSSDHPWHELSFFEKELLRALACGQAEAEETQPLCETLTVRGVNQLGDLLAVPGT